MKRKNNLIALIPTLAILINCLSACNKPDALVGEYEYLPLSYNTIPLVDDRFFSDIAVKDTDTIYTILDGGMTFSIYEKGKYLTKSLLMIITPDYILMEKKYTHIIA